MTATAFAYALDEPTPPAVTLSLESLWAIVIAVAVPFAVGFLTKASWGAGWKWLLVIVFSAAIGFVTIAIQGNVAFTWENALTILLLTAGASQTYYRYVLDKLPSVKSWLEAHGVKDAAP
jgi:hypothetical protein